MFVERHMGEILAGEFDVSLTKNEDMPSKHGRRILDGARPLVLRPPSLLSLQGINTVAPVVRRPSRSAWAAAASCNARQCGV